MVPNRATHHIWSLGRGHDEKNAFFFQKQQESNDEKSGSESEEEDFAKLTFTVQDAKVSVTV